ncbi:hypothetical protein NPX79_02995 [Spiroplasma endosymbiont of Anurida maritima]|uniref:hypothetical protein n=1 Tax=Spiroplasma endosymbiont of Anurida maritima TaxID=2967972 RepID=UPI0036D33DDF
MKITLKNNLVKEFQEPLTIYQIGQKAFNIKEDDCWAGVIDGTVWPFDLMVDFDANLEFAGKDSKYAFSIINYSAALLTSFVIYNIDNKMNLITADYTKEGFTVTFESNKKISDFNIEAIKNSVLDKIKDKVLIKRVCFDKEIIKNVFKDNVSATNKINALPKEQGKKCAYLIGDYFLYNDYAAVNAEKINKYEIINIEEIIDNKKTIYKVTGLAQV